jgi:leucyl aminopeptidase (aminopeptidase T)
VTDILHVAPNERVLIVHDQANDEIGRTLEQVVIERRASVKRLDAATMASRPWSRCPAAVLAALGNADVSVLALSDEEAEHEARHALASAATAARTRHVQMVGTGRKAFMASMIVTPERLFSILEALRAAMRPNSKFSVRSPAGTHIEIEMAPHLRWFADGGIVRPGQWIQIPYGALITCPASVSGTYVVDAAMGGGFGARLGLLSSRPVQLTLDAGRVKAVDCRDAGLKRHVEQFIQQGHGHERIGLLTLGANVGILSPLGEILHDEHMPGVHLALGDSLPARTGSHWSAQGQLAFAGADADVDLDGEPLMRHGRYVRFS